MFDEKECRFAASHEWAHVSGDVATAGISNYAQQEISDVVFVELPKVGSAVERDKACAVIESVNAAADFMAPVSGVVLEVNEAVAEDPSLVNRSPHGDGWFMKIRMTRPSEAFELMDCPTYLSGLAH